MGGWGLLGTSEMCTHGFDCEFISNGGCFFDHTDLEMGLSDIPSGEGRRLAIEKHQADEKKRRPIESQAYGRIEILYGDLPSASVPAKYDL